MGKNAHEQIERIRSEYLSAYAARWGDVAANLLTIRYHKGWWHLTAFSISTPYRAKEIIAMTAGLRKRTEK